MGRETSFQEKLNRAYQLALELAYEDDECIHPTNINNDLVWAYVDGLIKNYHNKILSGRCSLQATIDYDMEKEEKTLNDHISMFKKMIKERTDN